MNRTLALVVRSLLLCAALGSTFEPADAATIRSWDSANQAGGDLFLGLPDNGYQTFRSTLLSRGHAVLTGISELTADNLLGVDVFFWGTSSHVLSSSEQTVLSDFINAGGLIILETDSIASEQAAANSAYAALGLGVIDPVSDGGNDANQGTFANIVTSTTVGLLADIRGQTWGGTNSPSVPGGGTVIGAVGTSNKWVEYAVGSGYVLGVADPYGWDIFTNPGIPTSAYTGPYYNPNNLNAYLNFIETNVPIPEPGTFMLIGSGLVGLAAWRRLTHSSV